MSKQDNIGSCVEHRAHLSISPPPMYVRNDIGHKDYADLGHKMKQKRIGSTLWVDDVSNKSGMRAKGGY
jgi:hypothetical protein